MTPTRLLFTLLASFLLASFAAAQTATWIAPGTNGTRSDWNDPANWDTGAVPNGSSAIAIINQSRFTGMMSPIPGGAEPVITGDVTLGELRFDLPNAGDASSAGIYVSGVDGLAGLTGTLRLEGPGLTVGTNSTGNYDYVDMRVQPGGLLELANQAMLSRTGLTYLQLRLFGSYGNPARLIFRDDSGIVPGAFNSTNTSLIGHAAIEFHDRSHAGDWPLKLVYNSSLNFFDQSSAQNAILTSDKDGNGAGVVFNDESTAAQATLNLQSVAFNGHATAGAAAITNAGFQNYSGHGQYSSYFTTVLFHDDSTAAQATISNNPFGILAFHDRSSASNATITSQGTVNFSGSSSFGSARLIAGSGSYMEGAGYDQSRSVTTGQVIFSDQATGGNGRIEIAAADAILDFSGLNSGSGTTGRAPLSATPTTTVVADDRVAFSLGSITNTAAGGTIYLGSNVLALGSDNRDMTLSSRISDVGGRSGSLTGEALKGGQLYKVGQGTLTVTHPDNNFADIGVFAGALNLAGGSVPSVTVMDSGRLTGTGLVRGALFNGASGTGAVVSPGNSVGTITVTGDYLQFAGGTLNMEIASPSSRDQLVINGRAFLNGRLNVTLLGGYVPVGNTTLPLLTASELNGQFTTINLPTGLGAALAPAIVMAPPSISLQVTQLPFRGFAGDSAAADALGAHLDSNLTGATGDFRSLLAGLNTLNAASLRTALDALAPDRYSVLSENGFLTAAARQAALERRLAASRATKQVRGLDLFFEVGYRKSNFDAIAGLPTAKSNLHGGTAGGLWRNDGFLLGASLTQEKSGMDLDPLGSRAELKSLTPAMFFQYAPDRFFLHATAAFSRDDYDLQRRIVYPGVDQTAWAAPSGRRTDLALTVGYSLPRGAWTVTPHAGLLSSLWNIDEFTETGAGAASLTIRDSSLRSVRTRLGAEAFYHSKDGKIIPRLSITWLHELRDDRTFQAGFAGAGSSFTVTGREAEKDLVQASLSLEKKFGRAASFHVTLGGAWGRSSSITSDLSAGFRWEF
jgi:uncharacterized protein with beta-barrel porin domain